MSIGDIAEAVGFVLVGIGILIISIMLEHQNRRLDKAEARTEELAQETRAAFTGWHRYFFARNQEPKA